MVQALAAQGADQAFRIAILPRRSRRDQPVANTHRPHPRCEDMSIGTVIVAHQLVGVSRESANKQFRRWQRQKSIDGERAAGNAERRGQSPRT
jgi:hypothetical protein